MNPAVSFTEASIHSMTPGKIPTNDLDRADGAGEKLVRRVLTANERQWMAANVKNRIFWNSGIRFENPLHSR
jgi:hypothetical protein